MVELGKDIFFGGIALIFFGIVGFYLLGLIIVGLSNVYEFLKNDADRLAIAFFKGLWKLVKDFFKLFNLPLVFRYLKHTREVESGNAGCFAVVLLIPFYLIMIGIAYSLVRDFIIPLFS